MLQLKSAARKFGWWIQRYRAKEKFLAQDFFLHKILDAAADSLT
jgi:hypothetical protein